MHQTMVALLIDADNVSSLFSKKLIEIGERYGELIYIRCYRSAGVKSSWCSIYGLEIIDVPASKNAVDFVMTIDALEMRLLDHIETFVIATADADLSNIAIALRERGAMAIGVADNSSSKAHRDSFDDFIQLHRSHLAETPDTLINPTSSAVIDYLMRRGGPHQKQLVSRMSLDLHKRLGICISAEPEGNWRRFLTVRGTCFKVAGRGQETTVELTSRGAALAKQLAI